MSGMLLNVYGNRGYNDISETDWFFGTVMTLSGMGIVDGYPGGDFRPGGTINADAFIKMVVTALGWMRYE